MLTLCLALYQSYICLAAGLYIALLIQVSSKSNSCKDINSIDGYIEGETQVVFMGEFPKSSAAYNSPVATRYYDQLTGASNSSITYNGTEYQFYYGILGRNLNITYNDVTISEAKEYADMPIYPSNGYCKMIDDRVVVKLSN